MYKITSKIIANRMKGVLSDYISIEHHGFLKGRSIHEDVATAQEVIHSIHTDNIEAMIMKVDLYKAYDSVDWSFIQKLLLKIGFSMKNIWWVMACVTGFNFAVIINGKPTKFFKAERGLRQGCTLSPLLFIVIMDVLSKSFQKATSVGLISGFTLSPSICISHSLFVDDLLFFGRIMRNQWFYTHLLLIYFAAASSLQCNRGKYLLIW